MNTSKEDKKLQSPAEKNYKKKKKKRLGEKHNHLSSINGSRASALVRGWTLFMPGGGVEDMLGGYENF